MKDKLKQMSFIVAVAIAIASAFILFWVFNQILPEELYFIYIAIADVIGVAVFLVIDTIVIVRSKKKSEDTTNEG